MAHSITDWTPVCRVEDLEVGRGKAALVHGQSLALFLAGDGEVYALANHDPYSRGSVLARGLVGTREGVPVVGSPWHGHVFELATGACVSDRHVRITTYAVRVVDGMVEVGPSARSGVA